MDNEKVMTSGKDRLQIPRQMDEIFDFWMICFVMIDMSHGSQPGNAREEIDFKCISLTKSYMCHFGIITSFSWVVSRSMAASCEHAAIQQRRN
jgi:hypothetical protein